MVSLLLRIPLQIADYLTKQRTSFIPTPVTTTDHRLSSPRARLHE